MNGLKIACVWIEELSQWVPLRQVAVVQRYTHEGKLCAQFQYENKLVESYIEYKEI